LRLQGGQGAVYNSGTLTWGTGNINSDPLFTDAANETSPSRQILHV
jgi:hypothetical protein